MSSSVSQINGIKGIDATVLQRHFQKFCRKRVPPYLHRTAIIRLKTAPNSNMTSTNTFYKSDLYREALSLQKQQRFQRDTTALQTDDTGYNFDGHPA